MDKPRANTFTVIIAKWFLYLYAYYNHLNGDSLTGIVGVEQWGWGKIEVKLVCANKTCHKLPLKGNLPLQIAAKCTFSYRKYSLQIASIIGGVKSTLKYAT